MNGECSRRVKSFAVRTALVILIAMALLVGSRPAEAQSRRGRGSSSRDHSSHRSSRSGLWRSRIAEEYRRRTGRDIDPRGERGGDWQDDEPEPVKPEKGYARARFVKWDRGKDGRYDALAIVVTDAEGKRTSELVVPNTGKVKPGQISPPEDIAALAGKLKIGDEVSVNYTYFKRKYTVDAVKLRSALSACDTAPFTFVRAVEVRQGDKKFLGVTAKRDKISWTFLVPNEEVSAASFTGPDGKPLGEGTINAPATRMLECLATVRSGDIISLQYAPDDYKFVLSDMRVSRIRASGKFERLSGRLVNGKRHDMAMVRVGTRTLSLVLPLSDPKEPADAAAQLAALLKDMRQWQEINIQYRRQDGVDWLDSVTIKP